MRTLILLATTMACGLCTVAVLLVFVIRCATRYDTFNAQQLVTWIGVQICNDDLFIFLIYVHLCTHMWSCKHKTSNFSKISLRTYKIQVRGTIISSLVEYTLSNVNFHGYTYCGCCRVECVCNYQINTFHFLPIVKLWYRFEINGNKEIGVMAEKKTQTHSYFIDMIYFVVVVFWTSVYFFF